MENFTLWNAWADKSRAAVTFYATSGGLQRINKGTREMIDEMLSDLGCPHDKVQDWTVRPFATDYLSDDLDSDAWEDRWQASFEVTVRMTGTIKFSRPSKYLVDSMASDRTWKGEEPVPDLCRVVADFSKDAARERFEAAARRTSPDLSVAKSPAHVRQTIVDMPATKSFFERGAKQAVAVEELAHKLGGTTHWRDRQPH